MAAQHHCLAEAQHHCLAEATASLCAGTASRGGEDLQRCRAPGNVGDWTGLAAVRGARCGAGLSWLCSLHSRCGPPASAAPEPLSRVERGVIAAVPPCRSPKAALPSVAVFRCLILAPPLLPLPASLACCAVFRWAACSAALCACSPALWAVACEPVCTKLLTPRRRDAAPRACRPSESRPSPVRAPSEPVRVPSEPVRARPSPSLVCHQRWLLHATSECPLSRALARSVACLTALSPVFCSSLMIAARVCAGTRGRAPILAPQFCLRFA